MKERTKKTRNTVVLIPQEYRHLKEKNFQEETKNNFQEETKNNFVWF